MRKLKALLALASLALFGLATNTYAVTLSVDASGQLLGASGVDVNGTLFDVEFVDGTCADVFAGCDETTDFIFGHNAAIQAAHALLQQVFLDTTAGSFDTDPELTKGCTNTFDCGAVIPYANLSLGILMARNTHVDSLTSPDIVTEDDIKIANHPWTDDLSTYDRRTFARFSISASVPEPSTLALIAIGLAGVGFAGRRKLAT